jgi:hypothetical protein
VTTSLAIRTRPQQQSAQLTAIGAVPLVRVRPAPPFEPPYDDEAGTSTGGWDTSPDPWGDSGSGSDPGSGSGPRSRGAAPPPAVSVPDPPPAGRPASPADGTPPRIGTGRHAAHRYVGLCLEVLEGFRPVGHLRRFTVPAAFDSVAGQLARPVARAGHQPSGDATAGRTDQTFRAGRTAGVAGRPGATAAGQPGAGVPGRHGAGAAARPATGAAGRPGAGRAGLTGATGDRIRLRRLRIAEPRDGAVEAVAVLNRAGRAWALALRLEYREDTWLCTHVEVV